MLTPNVQGTDKTTTKNLLEEIGASQFEAAAALDAEQPQLVMR
jgi:hypothetical protein